MKQLKPYFLALIIIIVSSIAIKEKETTKKIIQNLLSAEENNKSSQLRRMKWNNIFRAFFFAHLITSRYLFSSNTKMKKNKNILLYIIIISFALYTIKNQHIIKNITNDFLYQEELKNK